MKKLITALFLCFFGLAFAQESIVPVEQEPAHKVVLSNVYVEVLRALLPPGGGTLIHRHSHARVTVNLSEAKVREGLPGMPPSKALSVRPGSVSVHENDKQPYVHIVTNVGKTVYEFLDVELLIRPVGAPTEPIVSPAAENSAFRVYKWELAPKASTPLHTHSRPYLIIAVTKMQLAMADLRGETVEHNINEGDFHWVDTQVTHTLTNKGKEAGTVIEIELR